MSQRRPRQKKSKKIGCQATLKVTCYKKDSSNVAIVHKGPHSHEVGSIDDIQYLPRTSPSRKVIEESCMDKERGTGISDTEDSTDTVPTTTPIEETGFNDALENIERLKCALDKYRHEPHILSEERISLLHDNMLEIERLLSPFQLEDIGSNH
ncbi:hypothetical protein BDB01DRAFT_2861 [Pilobolus umbonatus]|nr:hypothetical protein BDB01DRAFT_2861 [Pilobolus umbonatus]